jgi:hypothetical protein
VIWIMVPLIVIAISLFILILIVSYVGLEKARSDNAIDRRFSKRSTGKITEGERSNLSIRPHHDPGD